MFPKTPSSMQCRVPIARFKILFKIGWPKMVHVRAKTCLTRQCDWCVLVSYFEPWCFVIWMDYHMGHMLERRAIWRKHEKTPWLLFFFLFPSDYPNSTIIICYVPPCFVYYGIPLIITNLIIKVVSSNRSVIPVQRWISLTLYKEDVHVICCPLELIWNP